MEVVDVADVIFESGTTLKSKAVFSFSWCTIVPSPTKIMLWNFCLNMLLAVSSFSMSNTSMFEILLFIAFEPTIVAFIFEIAISIFSANISIWLQNVFPVSFLFKLYNPQYTLLFLASIKEQIKVLSKLPKLFVLVVAFIVLDISDFISVSITLYAKLSNELTPTIGMCLTSENALIVAMPILTPVNEPGPVQTAKRDISSKVRFVLLKAVSTIGISFTEWVFSSSLLKCIKIFSLSEIVTPHIFEEVSILKIFILLSFLNIVFGFDNTLKIYYFSIFSIVNFL